MIKFIEIKVKVPRNRNLSGRGEVYLDGKLARTIEVLARGNIGQGDTSFLKYGNTPTGKYDGSVFKSSFLPESSYGRYGMIELTPTSGKALVAQDVFGRKGLYIHGGSYGDNDYWRGKGSLRATLGCIRVRNSDMQYLRNLFILQISVDNKSCQLEPVKITVEVIET